MLHHFHSRPSHQICLWSCPPPLDSQLGAALSYEAGLLQKDAANASQEQRHDDAAELTQTAVSMQRESLSGTVIGNLSLRYLAWKHKRPL